MSRVLLLAVRYFNPVARFVLATRLHVLLSGRLMLLTFTGRRSGRSFTTPVSYVREGSSLLVPGGGAWWKNLENGRQVQVRLRGTWRPVTPELIMEPVALAEVLRRMLAANPAISAFTGILPDPYGRPDAEALERERRRGFVVVQLRLDAEGGFVVADGTVLPADHTEALSRQLS
jgi:deazaflavin-dependent oxidoreductase (nitroreductase family)